jgi:hypothetical protein
MRWRIKPAETLHFHDRRKGWEYFFEQSEIRIAEAAGPVRSPGDRVDLPIGKNHWSNGIVHITSRAVLLQDWKR